jgi:hypothetical protein
MARLNGCGGFPIAAAVPNMLSQPTSCAAVSVLARRNSGYSRLVKPSAYPNLYSMRAIGSIRRI